ncbi:MAG: hypothetical protein IPG72_00330 [Ardenticatenales bacterium]|nr:hypothetical protein [Ardenticatenales bacterium]
MIPFPPSRRQRRAFAVLAAIATLLALAAAAPPHPALPTPTPAHAQAPTAANEPYLRPVDRWLGETLAVAVDGDRAYYSVGRAVAVADISDPASPRLIGRSAPLVIADDEDQPQPIDDLAASEGTVWTITRDTRWWISAWDVGDPTAVRLVATIDLGEKMGPIALDARGRIALVSYVGAAWPDRGIFALRRTESGIETVGRWQLEDPAVSVGGVVWRNSNEVVVALGGGGIGRLAVTEAADGAVRMTVIGQLTDPRFAEGARHLAIDGCRAYSSNMDRSSSFGTGFWVFDICGDGPPVLLAEVGFSSDELHNPASMAALTIEDRPLLIVADAGGGLHAIDATEPLEMEWRLTKIYPPITGEPVCHSDIAAALDRLVVAGCGLRVLQLDSNVERPVRDGAILSAPSYGDRTGDGPWLTAMAATDDAVLIGHGNVLSVVRPIGPLGPVVVGRVAYRDVGHPFFDIDDLAVAGHTAWVAPGDDSVVAIDLSDPRAPFVIESGYPEADVIAVTDGLLAASMGDAVELIDVTDPRLPHSRSVLSLEVPPSSDMAFAGDRLIASTGAKGLVVVDVRDPVRPAIIGRHDGIPTGAMAVADGLAVALADVGQAEDGLAIFRTDEIDEGRIRVASTVPLPIAAAAYRDTSVGIGHVAGRRVAVVRRGPTLLAVDITDPSHPVVGPAVLLPVNADGMAVHGDRAFLFGRRAGVEFSVFELGTSGIAGVLHLPWLGADKP